MERIRKDAEYELTAGMGVPGKEKKWEIPQRKKRKPVSLMA